jgi:hypothetical protein
MNKLFAAAAAVLVVLGLAGTAQAHMASEALKGAKKVSGVVPGMGEHWVTRKYPGAVFGVMNNKITFVEYEVKLGDLKGDKVIPWNNFMMPSFADPINHTDIEYMPKGHRGMEIPHVTFHMYMVSHAAHQAFMPPRK